ncbi:MFS general substrate transporter [Pisolithus croceorrhizus]|nr:MFS general substrate transporter [Pisolithus croceorrhizus]KAI6163047.1 MFS general substrate transporter [Pisolithus thermaeus]
MAIPLGADADPDPTSQIAWPATRYRQRTTSTTPLDNGCQSGAVSYQSVADSGKKSHVERKRVHFSTWDLFTLSASMAGAQVAWTIELGYGTPFLLSLGISEQVTSLVWLAGPISGLVAQPLIGAISDSSTSKYRRRYWICLSTAALVAAILGLAYCESVAGFLVDLYGGGFGDWDPERSKQVTNVAIAIAVVAFYALDFALNALQASLRNLLLDITPPERLNAGNAWHSRMTQAGNIVGYGFGFLPLAKIPIFSFLGGDQFRKFCIISMTILVITVWMTCWFHEEEAYVNQKGDRCAFDLFTRTFSPVAHTHRQNKLTDILENIYNAITDLPQPIRKVCLVQLCAFMGWFPFLFYSTTYVGQIMAYQFDGEPDIEHATRIGELAMLLYSIVAVIAGVVLPRLTLRDSRLLAQDGDDDASRTERLRLMLRHWQEEAAQRGKQFKIPRMPLLLRDIWVGAMLLFSVLMFSTFWISTVNQATVMISTVGVCWGVACWVPFAIVMEFLKDVNESRTTNVRRPGGHSLDECDPLFQPQSSHGEDVEGDASGEPSVGATQPVAGGTILGIHNLAIVMPQFIIALVASAIFHVVDEAGSPVAMPDPSPSLGDGLGGHTTYYGKNGVAWVLRFGGLCALVGALAAQSVPATKSEREMMESVEILGALRNEEEP